MKRLTILGFIVIVGMMFTVSAVIAKPVEPTSGFNVTIVNPLPVPVNGEMTVTNDSSDPVIVRDEGNEVCRREAVSFYEWYNLSVPNMRIELVPETEEGKIFVIETISVYLEAEPDTVIMTINLEKKEEGESSYTPLLFIPVFRQGETEESVSYAGYAAAGAVVAGGTAVAVFLRPILQAIDDDIRTEVTLNGYYVSADCPQP